MARAYIIARRNDLDGMLLHFTDLQPNAGQRNSVYDGDPQNHYVKFALGPFGATVVDGVNFASGSLNTTVAGNALDDDTTGGGDDVEATQVTEFGLATYLLDRVQNGGVSSATAPPLTAALANEAAQDLMDIMETAAALTITAINTALNAVGGIANTDLDGAATLSRSFGTVDDVLRILSGEAYRTPEFTIVANVGGQFQTLAARQALVDAQDVGANGGSTFVASGAFLVSGEAGFRATPTLIRTGALNISAGAGVLAGYKAAITMLNPNFAYTAADVTILRPRAFAGDGTTPIPATGVWPAVAIYDNTGAVV